jgi:hypothetical protein
MHLSYAAYFHQNKQDFQNKKMTLTGFGNKVSQ